MSKFKIISSLNEIETNGRTVKLIKVGETDIGDIYYEEDGGQFYYVTDKVVNLLWGENTANVPRYTEGAGEDND